MSEKHRLYITLEHRGGLPGFHWALLIAPKHPDPKSTTGDCFRLDIANTLLAGILDDQQGLWRYRDDCVNPLSRATVVATVLLTKLLKTSTMTVDYWKDRIDALVKPTAGYAKIVQGDKSYTCRVWLKDAVKILKEHGGEEFSALRIVDDEAEKELMVFGEKAKTQVLADPMTRMRSLGTLPMLDWRISSA